MLTELRLLARGLLRSPAYTVISAGTLGLAIGLNTAIFSLVSLFIFEQFPMKDTDTLAYIRGSNPQQNLIFLGISAADFLEYERENTVFEQLAATDRTINYVMDRGGEALRIRGYGVTANLLSIWGLEPKLGRDFTPSDDRPGAPDVAILGHGFWERQFGADPNAVDSEIRLNGRPTTIIGIMNPEVEKGFYAGIDVWTPLRLDPATAGTAPTILPEGRLKAGRTFSEARGEIGRIAADIKRRNPVSHAGLEVTVLSWDETLTSPDSYLVALLLAIAVGCVMLIACSNVATLMLARATVRAREQVVKMALGAGRGRIVAQMVAEGALLALVAVGVGLLMTRWIHRLLLLVSGENGPLTLLLQMAEIDGRVLLFASGIGLLAPILITLLPAIYTLRFSLRAAIYGAGRSAVHASGLWTRKAMVVSQIALALALMAAAGVLIRSMIDLRSRELGFSAERMLALRLELPAEKYPDDVRRMAFFDAVGEAVRPLPEVEGAVWTNRRPLMPAGTRRNFSIEGRPSSPEQMPWGAVQIIDPGYHRLLQIPLLQGRELKETDRADSARVAVISRRLAELHWPSASPIGERIHLEQGAGDEREIEIVGVAADVYSGDPSQPSTPILYVPRVQHPEPAMDLVLRTRTANPQDVAPSVRRRIWQLDPMLPVDSLMTLQQLHRDLLSGFSVLSTLLGIFAGFSLLMAAAGVYGVTSFSVAQRTREIGLRMALGAVAADVRRMVVGEVVRLTVLGIVIGLAGAVLLIRLLEAGISSARSGDPLTYVSIGALWVLVTLVAAYLPVRSATRVDPIEALRE